MVVRAPTRTASMVAFSMLSDVFTLNASFSRDILQEMTWRKRIVDPADPEKDKNSHRACVGVGPLILVLVGCVGVIGGLINFSSSDLVGSQPLLLLSAAGIAGGTFWFLRDARQRRQ